jgi:DNA-binding beta-propeller fold protein YncE
LDNKGNLMNQETQIGPTASGIGITADGSIVIVANWETDSVTAVDVVHGVVAAEYDLRPGMINPAQSGIPGGEFPFGVVVKGNNTVYVSSARDREIDVLDLSGSILTLSKRISVKGNPEKMTLNRAQSKLCVAVNNADALVIVDTDWNTIVSQVNSSAPQACLATESSCPKAVILIAI